MQCRSCKTRKLDLWTAIRVHLGNESSMLCSKCKVWDLEETNGRFVKDPNLVALLLCQSCKTEYHLKVGENRQCPNCSSTYWSLVKAGEPEEIINANSSTDSDISNSNTILRGDLERLIAAQNRTTHAVRAFVRFLFIQLTGITLAVFFWNLSTISVDQQSCFIRGTNCDGNPFLQLMAVAAWVAAVILSSRAGWSELEKSNID
jgi:hypothetical protein